jgi:NADH-quinone oxidoreductase subunit L
MYREAWMIWLIPLISSFIAYSIAKWKKSYAGYFSLGISIICFFLSLKILYDIIISSLYLPYQDIIKIFYGFGVAYLEFGILIDEFSAFMIFIISFISILIFIYSLGYMREEYDLGRYWFWINFSLGSTYLFVLSNNFFEMLLAFLMASLSDWGLISFWYKKIGPSLITRFDTEGEYNRHCGYKALITSLVAGSIMQIAIVLLQLATMNSYGEASLNFLILSKNNGWVIELVNTDLLLLFSILIIIGPLVKSAQFPFHDWLPESTAGPITTSTLIISVTTTNIGVYILGRLFLINYDLYSSSPTSELSLLFEIAVVCGLITIFLASFYALVARNLKKILAFSTSSQLGYIFFIFGVAGLYLNYQVFIAGVLCIFAHSIFTSLLFLASGLIIHSTEINNIHEMGSLRKYMKKTYVLMMIGAFSIVGNFALMVYLSIQLLASEIFALPAWILILFILAFLLTNFYIFRLIGLIFFGMESETIKNITIMEKMHKSSPMMVFPLIILAIVSLGLIFFYPTMIHFMSGSFPLEFSIFKLLCFLSNTFLSIGTFTIIVLIIIGFLITYPFYFTRKISPHAILTRFIIRDLYSMLKNRLIFNPLYYLFPKGIYKLGNAMRTFHLSLDKHYRKIAYFFRSSGELIRKFQTGKINLNLLYFVICILLSLIIIYLMVLMD